MSEHKFTYEEVATVLGVSRQTVYNWQRDGKIPEGDFDVEKLEKAVTAVVDMKEQDTRREVEIIRRRFRVYEAERLAAVAA